MARLRVSTVVEAPADEVWEDLRHIDRHVEWMMDAVEIRFTSSQREGTGTAFDCDTRVGPFRLTDRMEITKWEPGRAIGVRHVGLVTGTGVLSVRAKRRDRSKVVWRESLRFPWWMGGPAGAWASVPILTLVWRRSMGNLADRFEP